MVNKDVYIQRYFDMSSFGNGHNSPRPRLEVSITPPGGSPS